MADPALILPQVRDALAAWGLDPAACDVALASMSENIVYRVTTPAGERFAYRIHRPGYHTFEELVAEHAWTAALADAGFLLPRAVPTNTGDYYVAVTVDGGTRHAGLVRWLSGRTLYERERSGDRVDLPAVMTELGSLMARLHGHARMWQPPAGFTRHHLDIDGFFGPAPHWGRYWESPYVDDDQRDLLARSRRNLVRVLQDYGTDRSRFGMIHADLHHGNVFLGDDGKMYVIDFDDAGFGWYAYDIAVALQEFQHRPDFEAIRSALLDGYRAVRDLAAADVALVPMFMHIRSRATIGWATARPELNNVERLRELVIATCNEAKQYL